VLDGMTQGDSFFVVPLLILLAAVASLFIPARRSAKPVPALAEDMR